MGPFSFDWYQHCIIQKRSENKMKTLQKTFLTNQFWSYNINNQSFIIAIKRSQDRISQ